MFHNLVAKNLYTTKCARLDTCTAVFFLTTIVRDPNNYYWRNLVHLMKYIRVTRDLPLILSPNDSGVLKLWIEAFYAVHTNMRGDTGEGLSMGIGFTIVTSTKHNINTRSSTNKRLFEFITACWLYAVQGILRKPRDTKSCKELFTKTTRAPLSWRIMVSN